MKRECETCIKRKTPYCPTSIDCMATDDMPYYQNRIMLLEENQELKSQLEEYKKELEKADSITQSCIFNGKKDSSISYRKCLNMLENLKEENQLLKKQFEEYRMDIINGKPYIKLEFVLNQQKEFISYLENEIYNIVPKGCGINFFPEDGYDSEEDFISAMKEQSRLNTLKEILSKYKEIIGCDKE